MHQRPGELRLAVFDGDAVMSHPLPREGSVTIGRGDRCDIRIDNPAVSRRHAVLHLGPPLRIEDLGGAGGTFVRDGRELPEKGETQGMRQVSKRTVELRVGDGVVLGSTMIVVRRAPVGERERASSGGRAATPAGAVIAAPVMRALYDEAYRAAETKIAILLLGETGVGKEVLARAIHQRSPRAKGPFLAVSCAAISESLLESELFGHEKGAFTGAAQARVGLFESAEGGTLFLDEVGEMSPSVQVKLLRFLEDRRITRVGGRTERAIDVRFIAATNRDLDDAVARGVFREDLFFRLSAMTLAIPPLRERIEELAPLAELLVKNACLECDRPEVPRLSEEALRAMERYAWPGNVRELRNSMDRAVVLCAGDALLPEHLPPRVRGAPAGERLEDPRGTSPRPAAPPSPRGGVEPLDQLRSEMEALERQRIVDALEQCNGNQTYAAELLGIARRTLVTKIQGHRIPRPRRRPDRDGG